jgi:RNA polymerase sigma-70 factor, ECF subfamily
LGGVCSGGPSWKECTLRSAEERFEELYRGHRDQVLAYALRRSSPGAAQDVVAETFAIAWRRLDAVPDAEPAAWLFGTARKVLAGRRRRELRQEQIAERLEAAATMHELGAAEAPDASPVLAALAALHESDREALLLAAWEGLNSREAAAVLGCSRAAFRIRLHRARSRLREQMSRLEQAQARSTHSCLPAAPQVKEIS